MAYVEGVAQSGAYITEPVDGINLPCCVARALVEPRNGRVPIRLLNPKPDPIKVKNNVSIATLELVHKPCESNVIANASAIPNTQPENLELESFLWEMVLDDQQKEQVFVLLTEFADVFAQSSADVGRTNELQHEIHTGGNRPIRQAARRLPPHRRQEVQKLLQSMRENDVIQPSKSPWASPIVLVRKKDNRFRFCVDYRKLNDVTHKDAYPLPRINDTLNTLAGSKWFSTLDLASGYWEVEVAEKDCHKTAFSTSEGLFEYSIFKWQYCK